MIASGPQLQEFGLVELMVVIAVVGVLWVVAL